MKSLLTHLECSKTGEHYDADVPQNLSRVGAPLLARYDLSRGPRSPRELAHKPGLWRYAALLPVRSPEFVRDLGEGGTPLFPADRLGAALGMPSLLIKEESVNPTGSFKARGMAVAVARAAELGIKSLAVGSAGNAGSALGAYTAALGLEAHIAMPKDTPASIVAECRSFGVDLALIDGLITDANAHVQRGIKELGWFDMATLREPYRLEGKKTMGYELFEQLDGHLPDVIIYPTGGGTGLIGMWKAFDEMEQLGWIGSQRPRMISVQAAGCAPIVRAFEEGTEHAAPWENAHTSASGLRVPRAIADFLILDAVRKSGGCALAVTEEEMFAAWRQFCALTGLFCAPEGAATLAALQKLLETNLVQKDERVVLFNTGSGLKYLEAWALATA
ncbi:MAG: threonine synthase [Armatimonadetes bacterium]|nr:threonine synthase [Armatimonadota bacterium]